MQFPPKQPEHPTARGSVPLAISTAESYDVDPNFPQLQTTPKPHPYAMPSLLMEEIRLINQ